MKKWISKCLLGIALLAAIGAGQDAVPVDKEPNHHVVFQNAYVRVIDASIEAGKATLFHTHTADNVPVVILGGPLKTEFLGGKTTESTAKTGTASFVKGGYTHRITNLGTTPLHFIDAEVLSSPPVIDTIINDDVDALKMILENDRVRIYELKLAPKQTSGVIEFARPVLSVEVSGGKASEQAVDPTDSPLLTRKTKAGGFVWHDQIEREVISNEGSKALDSIYIEWK